jgi:DNA-binding beta-propeller fold protein YncE
MDPASKKISIQNNFPLDAYAPYAYPQLAEGIHWYSNDGDSESGVDTLNCSGAGSPVYVVKNSADGAEVLKTICLGRGHHVVAFSKPSAKMPNIPQRAFVTHLLDGSMTILGNDPADQAGYLNVIDTINLCESDKEKDGRDGLPNNAFPHGMVFSPLTGKIYSLNNGYGTIIVVDPSSGKIESRLKMKGSSNLLLSPDGRYLIGKGANRKSDPEHVVGRLSVLDITTGETTDSLDLSDFYPSTYRFNPQGNKLYVTSAATGKGAQRDKVRKNILQVYDAAALPKLRLIKEVSVGVADCSRRPIAFFTESGETRYVFVPNPTEGSVSILDGSSDEVLDTISIAEQAATEFAFSLWDGTIYGC